MLITINKSGAPNSAAKYNMLHPPIIDCPLAFIGVVSGNNPGLTASIFHFIASRSHYCNKPPRGFDFQPPGANIISMDPDLRIVWQKADQPVIAADRKGFALQMAVSIVRHLLDVDPDLQHMREQGHHVFIRVWPKEKNTIAYNSLAEMLPADNAEIYIITIMEWTFGVIKTPDTISAFEYPKHSQPKPPTN